MLAALWHGWHAQLQVWIRRIAHLKLSGAGHRVQLQQT